MTHEERVEFATMNIVNGNLTDAINFIMHDGDVRADSVVLALQLVRSQILRREDLTDDSDFTVRSTIDRLIRLIEQWETT